MNKSQIRRLERVFKGVANHRRIEILLYLENNKDVSLDSISDYLGCNFKTISEHTRKLKIAGLINKIPTTNYVKHRLTPYGEEVLNIMRDSHILQN
ncbi:MAG: winged helix-turn-helix domain-containing protein [Candidatus Berkelbacteria bacterium]|nr:winged helix-turn-helix domain-containing protein [Candidatus Berkelbacteria bacterium]